MTAILAVKILKITAACQLINICSQINTLCSIYQLIKYHRSFFVSVLVSRHIAIHLQNDLLYAEMIHRLIATFPSFIGMAKILQHFTSAELLRSLTGRLKTLLGRTSVITVSGITDDIIFIVISRLVGLSIFLFAWLRWLLLLWRPAWSLLAVCNHCTNSNEAKLGNRCCRLRDMHISSTF